MKWSWNLGRIFGIELRIHATFLLLLAWLALIFYRNTGTAAGALSGVIFTLALFACVVLHELGHATAARQVGVPTRDITLLPIGGVARLEYMPDKPRHELWIAIAGPLVTALIAVVLFVAMRVLEIPSTPNPELVLAEGEASPFVARLFWVNIWLLGFNMLPAFPMDGGRVLRALLAMRMDYLRATDVAARIGKGFALLFGLIGLMYNPFLVLIALFVWMGAAGESAALQLRAALSGVPVDQVMVRDVRTLAPADSLDTALHHVLDGFQQDFPVVENGSVVGVLTRSRLLDALGRHGREARVDQVMDREFRTTHPTESAEVAVARLQECRCHSMPVVDGNQLRGVLTLDNVGEYIMFETAMAGKAKPR